jgi:hypothetical protein
MHAVLGYSGETSSLSSGSMWYVTEQVLHVLQMQVPQSPTQQHAEENSEASASEGGAMRVPMRHEIRANRCCTAVILHADNTF